jgi:hypothetical protein
MTGGLDASVSRGTAGQIFELLEPGGCDCRCDVGVHSEFLSFAVNFTASRMN